MCVCVCVCFYFFLRFSRASFVVFSLGISTYRLWKLSNYFHKMPNYYV